MNLLIIRLTILLVYIIKKLFHAAKLLSLNMSWLNQLNIPGELTKFHL